MIPKRAIFFWEGPQMSWLRKQSMATFAALNPEWDIMLLDGSDIPVSGNSRLEVVWRSDWARYRALAKRGGVYFDTDIMFCKPIPADWLRHELILPIGTEKIVGHVAMLGAQAGDAWFSRLDAICGETYRSGQLYDYQEFGVPMLNASVDAIRGRDVLWTPHSTVLPVAWDRTAALWTEGLPLTPLCLGVHWFGGDWVSIAMEQKVDQIWAETSTSIVSKAWQKAFAGQAQREALRDNIGV